MVSTHSRVKPKHRRTLVRVTIGRRSLHAQCINLLPHVDYDLISVLFGLAWRPLSRALGKCSLHLFVWPESTISQFILPNEHQTSKRPVTEILTSSLLAKPTPNPSKKYADLANTSPRSPAFPCPYSNPLTLMPRTSIHLLRLMSRASYQLFLAFQHKNTVNNPRRSIICITRAPRQQPKKAIC